MKRLVIFIITLAPLIASASEQDLINKGDNWVLEARSNRLSSDSKVLYYIPSDAYHTYHAREFGDWEPGMQKSEILPAILSEKIILDALRR